MNTKELLENARVIAVVGYSDKPWRDSNRIAGYLQQEGYTVYAVNPTIETGLDGPSYPDVKSIPEPVDIVDVFRNPAYVGEVVDDAIAAGAKAIWLQLGVTNPEAEQRAEQAGLTVVVDRCIMVEHRLQGVRRRS